MTFIRELRRRNVIRMAGLYLVGAWLLVQVASTLFPAFGVPDWAIRALVIVLALGFVPALVFAWVFELTPDGIKRDAEVTPEASIAPQTAQRMDRIIIAVLGLALVYFALDKFVLAPHRVAAPAAPVASQPANATAAAGPAQSDNSIAVLPFVDMSQQKDQEYFSDGLSEELLNQLAQVPQLRVIARTSSFSFKGKEVGIDEIARILKVGHVLEGSVRKSGNTLRITAQLIRTSDSSHLWSKTYDRELTDVFKVQDEIAAAVVEALKVKLLPGQDMSSAHRSTNAEAYNQYLRGNSFVARGNQQGWQLAIAAYQRALRLDPDYGAAQAALSAAHTRMADALGDEAMKDQAIAEANKAIALAPGLAEAYISRGTARLTFKRDWNGAQADYEKGMELDPRNSAGPTNYARVLIARGQLPEAIGVLRKAIELDPLTSGGWAQLGRMLNANGDLPAARQALDRSLELSPESNIALFHRGLNDLLQQRPREAMEFFRKAQGGYGGAGRAMGEHSIGNEQASRRELEAEIANFSQGAAYQIAEVYAWRGEPDQAFEWLERAYAQNDGGLTFLKVDPLMGALKHDPRYPALLKKLGLPE